MNNLISRRGLSMHVTNIPGRRAVWYLRPLFFMQRRKYGEELRAASVWARVPSLYLALGHFYSAIERKSTRIPPSLRSLIQTYVSQLNHCDFCVDLNASIASQRLGNMDKVVAVSEWETSDKFDDIERNCLEYAQAITLSDRVVSKELIEKLRTHWNEEALIELTALISFQNMSSKFNAALDIESMGFCSAPRQP